MRPNDLIQWIVIIVMAVFLFLGSAKVSTLTDEAFMRQSFVEQNTEDIKSAKTTVSENFHENSKAFASIRDIIDNAYNLINENTELISSVADNHVDEIKMVNERINDNEKITNKHSHDLMAEDKKGRPIVIKGTRLIPGAKK